MSIAVWAVNLFLLQGDIKYFKDDNPMEVRIFLIAIGALVVFLILLRLFRRGTNLPVAGKKKSSVTPRKFNFFTLRRIASACDLDRDQTKLLEFVFRNDAVSDPERVMKNPALLDRHFKRAYKTIERNSETEEDAQQRLVRLFSLRNVIEAAPDMDSESSDQLAENTPAILVRADSSYPVKVLSSRGQSVIVEVPRNSLGTPVRLPKGTRVSLSFFTKSSKGFSFDGHIEGALSTDQGPGIQIVHTGKIKPLVKRKFRRRQTSIRCEFFLVRVEETGSGRRKTSRLIMDRKRFTGTVLDISIGGCSIKTTAPIPVGTRLKISIDYDDNSLINVLGQVLRTNRSGAAGTILHIKFLKVPRRAFNSIGAMVFGYDED